jgi:hypothetical protein
MTDFSNPLFGNTLFVLTVSATAGVGGPKQSDGKPLGYCLGFVSNVSGTITAISRGDTTATPVTIPVNAGQVYPFALKQVLATSVAMILVGYAS